MPKGLPRPKKHDQYQQYDVLTLFVGRAGIGRMRFKAWFDHEYRDAQDGNDDHTYDNPREAVMARFDELEEEITLRGWSQFFDGKS